MSPVFATFTETHAAVNPWYDTAKPVAKKERSKNQVPKHQFTPETTRSTLLDIELPGVPEGDVSVDVKGRLLTVKGIRLADNRKTHYCMELMLIGKIDGDRVQPVDFTEGVLTLRITGKYLAKSKLF